MIVKVRALRGGFVVENKDGEQISFSAASSALVARMRGRAKSYFRAYEDEHCPVLNLDEEVGEQAW